MGEIHQTPHIIALPTPGMGHLIPLTEFAKRLVHSHDFSVTFLIPTDSPPSKAQKTVLNSLPKSIDYVFLPPVNFDDLPEDVRIETRISLTVSRSIPAFRDAVQNIMANTRVVALVVDLFGTDAFDVGKELDVPSYIFYPTTAMALSLFFELPKLDETYLGEYRDLPEPLRLSGCAPLPGADLADPLQDKKNEAYTWILHHVKRYKYAEGILVNTFLNLEPGALEALMEKKPDRPWVYPVGPLTQTGIANGDPDGCECLKWLDGQPHGSVLFISFGSGGTLSSEQLNELAFGLEMSEQRFLWVVRSPNDKAANASYFTAQSDKDPFDFLPEGFIERTKHLGLVVPSWAPQIQVLSHSSTGGFLTHCGWNSTLESTVHGVPLIAWPLFAEQKMNAIMLNDMKVALRPKFDTNGIVRRVEIAEVIKGLMEGEEGKRLRNKMKDLKDAAAAVLSEHGSSTKSLSEVALRWKNHKY
nr:glycosyltransferase UGT37 [Helleborus thibetanus]